MAADILCFTATVGVWFLSYLDHQRSLRPSTLLTLYFSQSVVLGIARTRTLWLMEPSAAEPIVMTVMLSLTLIALVLESMQKKPRSKGSQQPTQCKQYSPEQYSGLWGRTSFAWLVATLRVGYSKIISVNDLPPLDTQLQAHVLRQKLLSTWATCELPIPMFVAVLIICQTTDNSVTVCFEHVFMLTYARSHLL